MIICINLAQENNEKENSFFVNQPNTHLKKIKNWKTQYVCMPTLMPTISILGWQRQQKCSNIQNYLIWKTYLKTFSLWNFALD